MRTMMQPKVAFGVMGLLAAFLVVGSNNHEFFMIITKGDNMPILIMMFSVMFFLWLAFRQATINDMRLEKGEPPTEALDSNKKVLVWPDLVYSEFLVTVILSAIFILWSVAVEAPIEEPASGTRAPNPAKAPWYFLGLQEMLVYFDPWLAGVVLPGLIVVGLMAIPYIDTNPKGNGYYTFKERKFAITMFLFGFLIMWVVLVIMGTFLRGPNWNFFGPFEFWDPHKIEALVNVNLSEFFWVKWLDTRLPDNPLVRELPGILLIAGYFVIMPALLAKTLLKKFFHEMGFARYSVLAMLLLCMASLPIKMILRWTVNLKYLVAIPEWFFNI
ncbi:MAG: cytochrome C [Planctomycetes bacterium]|nr:cytochrome C [Planctomycetota bacterium]